MKATPGGDRKTVKAAVVQEFLQRYEIK